MFERDVFVAVVAFGLGAFIVHAALIGRPICFEFWLVKRLEKRYGRSVARNIVALVGGLIILLGIFVLLFPSKTHRAKRLQSESGLVGMPVTLGTHLYV